MSAAHTLATFIAAIAHHASLPIATSVDEGDLLGGSLLTHVDVEGGRITAVLRDYRTSDSDEGDGYGYDTLVFVVQPDVAVTSTEDLPDSIDAAIVAICEALIAVQDGPAPVALRGEVSQTLLDLADAVAVARPEDAADIDAILAGPATSEAVGDLRGFIATTIAGTGSTIAWDLYRESGAYTLDSMVGREPAPGSDDDTYPAVPHPIEATYTGAWVAVYGSERTAHVEATRALPPPLAAVEQTSAEGDQWERTGPWLPGVWVGPIPVSQQRALGRDVGIDDADAIPVHGAYVPIRAGGVGHPSPLVPVRQPDGVVTTASSQPRRRMHLTTEGWWVEVPDRRGNLRFQITGDADHRPLDPMEAPSPLRQAMHLLANQEGVLRGRVASLLPTMDAGYGAAILQRVEEWLGTDTGVPDDGLALRRDPDAAALTTP